MHQNLVQFEPTLKIEPFSQVLFHSLFSIFMGFQTLNIKCLYVTMAQEVHRSHLSAIQWNILSNVFVSVDTITLYIAQCNVVCVNRNDIIKHAFLEYTVMIFLRNLYCHHFTIHGFKCNNINLIKVSVKEAAMRSRFMPLRRRYKLGDDSRR